MRAVMDGSISGHLRPVLPRRRPVVLMHHGFTLEPRQDDPEKLFVTQGSLAWQLQHLRSGGWTPLDLNAYLTLRSNRRKAGKTFLFTVDDGYVSVATVALPLLKRFAVPLVLFVPAGLVGRRATWLEAPADEPILSADVLRELAADGVEIGGHGLDHRSMAGLDDAELRRQCVDVREQLADATGRLPRSFAYPFGHFDRRAQMAVEAAGYEVAFSVHDDAGPFAISRVDVNGSDDSQHFRFKLLPAYRPVWRAAGRVRPLRSTVRRALGYRRKAAGQPARVPPGAN